MEALARIEPLVLAKDRLLPVLPSLEAVLPGGGLRRGSTVAVSGSTSLALAVAAGPSCAGSWCAAVGMPWIGMVAAASFGVDTSRFALIGSPGSQWAAVAAALVDSLDVVLVAPPSGVREQDVRRLQARARERGAVVVCCGTAPGGPPGGASERKPPGLIGWRPDVELRVAESRWDGIGSGHGHLHRRLLTIVSGGRGAASLPRRTTLRIP